MSALCRLACVEASRHPFLDMTAAREVLSRRKCATCYKSSQVFTTPDFGTQQPWSNRVKQPQLHETRRTVATPRYQARKETKPYAGTNTSHAIFVIAGRVLRRQNYQGAEFCRQNCRIPVDFLQKLFMTQNSAEPSQNPCRTLAEPLLAFCMGFCCDLRNVQAAAARAAQVDPAKTLI